MKRFVPWVVVIVALLLVALMMRQWHNGGTENYQIATVTRGPITQAVTATGTLNPVVNVQVGSQVSGNIAKLFADFNSQVKACQVVAQIDPALFQATVTQAEGDLANAQAALELARINARRTQELFAKKTSSQADVDQAVATLHQAEANVKIKQGALDKAKADLDHCTITSPIDGVVISRSVDVGQTVAASLQAPVIFAIANDLTKMQIKNAALRYHPADATPVETRSTSSGTGQRQSGGRFAGSRSGGTRERQIERTVYVLPNGASRPEPVQIKTGISDGVVTEVAEGL